MEVRPYVNPERWLTAASPDGGLYYLCGNRGSDPPGLGFHRTKAGRRKLRLFACACVRRIWEVVPRGACRKAVELAERLADGEAVADRIAALPTTEDRSAPLSRRHAADAARACGSKNIWYTAALGSQAAARAAAFAREEALGDGNHRFYEQYKVEEAQVVLLADVFEDAFRPVVIDRRWRTETVVALARGVYAERAFDRLPILADALEEAGCDLPAVLDHCRGNGPHVQGCWVVDLLAGQGRKG